MYPIINNPQNIRIIDEEDYFKAIFSQNFKLDQYLNPKAKFLVKPQNFQLNVIILTHIKNEQNITTGKVKRQL